MSSRPLLNETLEPMDTFHSSSESSITSTTSSDTENSFSDDGADTSLSENETSGAAASPTRSSGETDPMNNPQQKSTSGKSKKEQKIFEFSPLPSIEEIIKVIPEKGIALRHLIDEFADKLDGTNVEIFGNIIDSLGGNTNWVKRPDSPPSQQFVDKMITAARTPTNETRKAVIKDPIAITFGGTSEYIRSQMKIRPTYFYRVYYEDSATLCAFTPIENHTRNSQKPGAKLHPDNAFQSIGSFAPERHMNRDRIERHTIWNKKYPPTVYISVFNNEDDAKRRCDFLYNLSKRTARRVSVAQIDARDLVPITFRGRQVGQFIDAQDVAVPAWVAKEALDKYGDDVTKTITMNGLKDSGTEIWYPIVEIRMSNLRVPATRAHTYEWLAGGFIRRSKILDIWPYDGKKWHNGTDRRKVTSLYSREHWLWDKTTWTWQRPNDKKRQLPEEDTENRACKKLRNFRQENAMIGIGDGGVEQVVEGEQPESQDHHAKDDDEEKFKQFLRDIENMSEERMLELLRKIHEASKADVGK